MAFSNSSDMALCCCLSVYLYGELYLSVYICLTIPAYLMLIDAIFDVFFDLVCKYFIENYYIYIHKGNWSGIVFLCLALYRVAVAL